MILDRVGIRTRISGGSLIIAILISLIAGIIINTQIERIVRLGTIEVLRSDAAPYVVALKNEPGESFDSPGPSQLVAVVDPDGATPIDTLPSRLQGLIPAIVTDDETRSVTASGVQYLVRATPVEVLGETWFVIAARNDTSEAQVLGQMRVLLVAGLAFISVGVAVTAWLLTSASLGPVRRLRTTAENLSDAASTELLPVGPANDEIARLATTLNDLIGRLRASAARERALVSDASHELRTPLAILRTQLELARTEASSMDQLLGDIRGAEKSAARLSTLLSSLLELSAIEASEADASASSAQLVSEVEGAIERARFRSPASIELTMTAAVASFALRSEDFGRVVDNLLNNSIAAAAGEIRVSLAITSGQARLSVADDAGGLDPDFVARATERFSRQDAAREPHDGAGLGLAIVDAIVTRAGGELRLVNDPGVGLEAVLIVPAHPSPAS